MQFNTWKRKRIYLAFVDEGLSVGGKSAKGMVVTDVDDNVFLDFTAGVAVCNTGHNHDQVISSITNQADTLIHMSGADFYNPSARFSWRKTLSNLSWLFTKRVFFGNSGAESVEAAFKLALPHQAQHCYCLYNAFMEEPWERFL